METSVLGARLARGVFWAALGTLISRGLMLIASVLVARILGKTVYGELGIVQSTIGMFGVFAGFGLGLTATKHVAEYRQSDPERAGRIIGLSGQFAFATGGLMAIGLSVFAPWLAEHTINAPHLAGVLRIGALMLFINALNGAQTGALSGFEAFKLIAQVNLFVGLISFPVLVYGAYFGGLTGAVWALVGNLCLNWLLNHLALRREAKKRNIPFSLKNSWSEWDVLWKFSLPALLNSVLVGPINWVCGAILVNHENGYAEMGIFNAANQWFAVMMFLPSMIGNVILPIMSEQIGNCNLNKSRQTLVVAIAANLIIMAPIVLLSSIFSQLIIGLYGTDFASGQSTLVIILITSLVLAIQTPVGQIIAASNRMWFGIIMNAGWAIIFILFTLFLSKFGAFGLASARMLSYIIHAVWTFWFATILIREGSKN